MFDNSIKQEAIKLRFEGKSYLEITKSTGVKKSTLSYWFRRLILPQKIQKIIFDRKKEQLVNAQKLAVEKNKINRKKYLESLNREYEFLKNFDKKKDLSLIVLASLYLGEGSKTNIGYLTFGNSDPKIIELFLKLLRLCFNIDEKKFRCTIQCRSGQNITDLEKFWSLLTNIPKKQFYKARIDKRTVGKPMRKLDYKGVCRLEYLCADVYYRILAMIYNITGR